MSYFLRSDFVITAKNGWPRKFNVAVENNNDAIKKYLIYMLAINELAEEAGFQFQTGIWLTYPSFFSGFSGSFYDTSSAEKPYVFDNDRKVLKTNLYINRPELRKIVMEIEEEKERTINKALFELKLQLGEVNVKELIETHMLASFIEGKLLDA